MIITKTATTIEFLGLILVVLMLITTTQYQSSDASDAAESQFSKSQLEEMTSKCIEVDQKGSLDSLKFKDTNLWLMCMQLILEEQQKEINK